MENSPLPGLTVCPYAGFRLKAVDKEVWALESRLFHAQVASKWYCLWQVPPLHRCSPACRKGSCCRAPFENSAALSGLFPSFPSLEGPREEGGLPKRREDCPRGGRSPREEGELPEEKGDCRRRESIGGGEVALPKRREDCQRRGRTSQEEGGLPE